MNLAVMRSRLPRTVPESLALVQGELDEMAHLEDAVAPAATG
jgi:hypothetical protein